MTIQLKWYSEAENILKIETDGEVTWDDWHLMLDDLTQQLKSTEDHIDIINVTNVPFPSGNPLPHIKRLDRILQKNDYVGLHITVSPSHAKVVVQGLQRMMRIIGIGMGKGDFAATVEEAYTKIITNREKMNQAHH